MVVGNADGCSLSEATFFQSESEAVLRAKQSLEQALLPATLSQQTRKDILDDSGVSSYNACKRKAYALFDEPSSSKAAQRISLVMIAFVMLSIVTFCAQSMPDFSPEVHETWKHRWNSVECVIIAVFSVDYLVRFWSTPLTMCRFLTRPSNVVDILSILPWYVEVCEKISAYESHGHINLAWLRLLRLGRLLRVFKLSRYLTSLEVIRDAFVLSAEGLAMVSAFLAATIVFFSALLWFAERGDYDETMKCFLDATLPNTCASFESVPVVFYWSVTTLSTVGYGDMAPKSAIGRFLTCTVMVTGVLCVAMPVTILSNNFHEAWTTNQSKKLEGKLTERLNACDQNDPNQAGTIQLYEELLVFRSLIKRLLEITPEIRTLLEHELEVEVLDPGFNALESTLIASASSFKQYVERLAETVEANRPARKAIDWKESE